MTRKLGAWETVDQVRERNVCGASTRSKQHAVFGGGPFPRRVVSASGAHVRCDDGKVYVDWVSALGAVGLGYARPEVDAAVQEAIARGVVTGSLPHAVEEDAAEQLCETLGWPEQVRWVNSGSEATEAAMRLARRFTGRGLVYSVGYHGHHQAHLPGPDLVTVPAGVVPPRDFRAAAVIVECGREEAPTRRSLYDWRDWCDGAGALLIMDEVWSGFRVAVGGVTEKYSVRPDLATFSKALGNGYPVAAVVGAQRVMKYAHEVSSTFGGNAVGLAAARAVMTAYREVDVIGRLTEVGARLLRECPEVLTGTTARPHFRAPEHSVEYVQRLAVLGHLVHPAGVTPTFSHQDADVDSLLSCLNEIARE